MQLENINFAKITTHVEQQSFNYNKHRVILHMYLQSLVSLFNFLKHFFSQLPPFQVNMQFIQAAVHLHGISQVHVHMYLICEFASK